jgi:uncharacterized protein (UPF0332 family)
MASNPFNPEAFLRLAEELARDDPTEARLRTAISRAYYALFHLAYSKVDLRSVGGNNLHDRVVKALRSTDRQAGELLDGLRRLRNVADYQLTPQDLADRNWPQNWSRSESIIRRLKRKLDWL